MEEPIEPRIRTSHTGSLPRAHDLVAPLIDEFRSPSVARERDGGLEAAIAVSVSDVVRRQVETGIDLVNDGEQSKPSYALYIKDRLTGFGGVGERRMPADIQDFPGFAARFAKETSRGAFPTFACIGPVRNAGTGAAERDVANLRSALAEVGKTPCEAFVTAASPGVITLFFPNQFYTGHEEYLFALADAMKTEYDLIHDSGFTLQLDCPDLANGRNTAFAHLDLDGFRRIVALHVEALNHAVRDIPPERMRLHLCWGNYEGPHHRDVPLRDIVDIVLRARPATLSFEAANPRHEHEWRIWEEVALPEDKMLMPGVIDSTTNYIEHPELVAERLLRFARIAGTERVIGATDCGLSTVAGMSAVEPEIAWAKLASLVEGARLASFAWDGMKA